MASANQAKKPRNQIQESFFIALVLDEVGPRKEAELRRFRAARRRGYFSSIPAKK